MWLTSHADDGAGSVPSPSMRHILSRIKTTRKHSVSRPSAFQLPLQSEQNKSKYIFQRYKPVVASVCGKPFELRVSSVLVRQHLNDCAKSAYQWSMSTTYAVWATLFKSAWSCWLQAFRKPCSKAAQHRVATSACFVRTEEISHLLLAVTQSFWSTLEIVRRIFIFAHQWTANTQYHMNTAGERCHSAPVTIFGIQLAINRFLIPLRRNALVVYIQPD